MSVIYMKETGMQSENYPKNRLVILAGILCITLVAFSFLNLFDPVMQNQPAIEETVYVENGDPPREEILKDVQLIKLLIMKAARFVSLVRTI